MTDSRTRILLVVDTGIDDALALALAVRHPRIHLEGVLTTWGNVGLHQVTDNTLRVLDWLGASHVPVFSGAAGPLAGAAQDAAYWHGPDGLGGARLPPSRRRAQPDAIRYLVDRLRRDPNALTLVCTAPLTTLALAVRQQPDVASLVRRVVLMGGAAHLPGNTTPVAEYNILADPEAAACVFDQQWPVTMVGLDVTNRVLLTRAEAQALQGVDSPDAVLVREVTRFSFHEREIDAMALHDPLAVGVALEPSLVSTVPGPVHVETRGEFTRGQTVVDWRPNHPRSPSTTEVCVDVDATGFRRLFFATLGLPLIPAAPAP